MADVPAIDRSSTTERVADALRTMLFAGDLSPGEPLREVLGFPNAQYEWGYDGSGPFTLAQSILWHEYGRDVPHRYRLRFATDVITRLPRQTGDLEWVLDSVEIALWFTLVRLLEKEQGIAFAKD